MTCSMCDIMVYVITASGIIVQSGRCVNDRLLSTSGMSVCAGVCVSERER